MAEPLQSIDQRKTTRETNMTALFNMIREITGKFSSLETSLNEHKIFFEKHMKTEEEQRAETNTKLDVLSKKIDEALSLKEAFPHIDGKPDIQGHRYDHTIRIESSKSSRRFWSKFKEELASKAAMVVIGFVVLIFGLGFHDWLSNYLKNPALDTKASATVGVKHE